MYVFYYTSNPIYNLLEWVIVRSYDEFVEYIVNNGIPNKISFDHDLADVHYEIKNQNNIDYTKIEKTGYHCAKWLANYCQDNTIKFPEYYIHTQNVVGGDNIKCYIENYKKIIENNE